jgi:dihydrofolate reductase
VSKVIVDISMSLDGYVTGPNDKLGQGLGEGGEILHHWVFGRRWSYGDELGEATSVDKEVLDETFGPAGAAIVGRRMFDVVEDWGYQNPFPIPCFVLTHRVDDELLVKAPSFTFVSEGIESALERARAVAGEKDVLIGGGANVIQQYLKAGLVDEMKIHLAPVLLGAGIRLFDDAGPMTFERTRVVESPFTTHLGFRVVEP